ncbi:protein FAM83G [Homo sapiens]|uniref:Protein FAM83G n=1 Tax=Homo sapiens TaxID=9606 RepID=FA83G_HUMAN|nr:protein FAM83G [Homo sapiens]XP_016880442.1 protein FAM83G isoform X1 [Homo sapiens]A6ND36.2 RecName: Full=Protein FAM83G; AltName: Full=Protein associated with SMAD1 [Homo sapiens]|eukprot:NP_001035088.2 protein FAM83G [Homo sapiens]
MAFSQVQCLDDNHVNWRSSESKPEFFYSEEQRLALEALVARGRDAFYEVLKRENIRDFLSELELKRILETIEVYDPGSEDPRGTGPSQGPEDNGVGDGEEASGADGVPIEAEPLPSLEYWPQKSDRSIPQLDLGWPDTIAYRGVTRASVYMQPPIDGQAHIKEVVRKMISQAQKVIAVVMDMFTDVDIFKDLLDAGFKRKVAVYIIVDESNVKYFLHMCERACMHLGHLKNLRVRSSGGTEFFTRSATKFKGALAQKFMFVDGDRAVCGSYSFTWSAARTDRNVISVLSGQVVEMFDRQFQELYLMSHSVSLKGIPMEKEPEPEPIVLPSVVPLVPAGTVAKKLVNPKYALVKAKSVDEIAKISSEKQEAKKPLGLKGPALAEHPGELPELLPPIHPGLLHLERANMFEYLPTWVEPDPEPGSDILGYINIIDPNIWNPQPSQMNRIKIRDTSQASAQHQLWKQSQDSRPRPEPCPPPEPSAPQDGVPAENGLPQGDPEPLPPVPKPRTVPVADVLARDSSDIGWVLELPKEEAPQNGTDHRLPRMAGPGHAPLQRQLSVTQDDPESLGVGLPNGLDGVEEEDDDDYVTLSDQDSHSGSSGRGPGPRRPSVASSVSEEYFEVREHSVPLRRRHSEQVANGPTPPPRRQLSAPHITRGTFVGPQGGSPWAQSRGREEADALKRMQAQRSTDKEAQGQQFHHHRVPASGTRDKDGFPGPPRYRSAADSVQSSTRNAGPAMAGPHHWQAKGGQVPRLLPDPGSPRLAQNARPMTDGRATEEHPSPFGIPYSKLSQSKHLKARTGGSQWASSDSKRRAQAPRDRKDP